MQPTRPSRRAARTLMLPFAAALLLGAGPSATLTASPAPLGSPTPLPAPTTPQDPDPTTVTLLTHDSFALSQDVLASFQTLYGATIRVTSAGDAGAMVNQAILTSANPLADVLYGVDTTFLSRALDAGIFEAYRATGLDGVAAVLQPADDRVTPIDYGDVCLNTDLAAFATGSVPAPTRLEDLARPEYAGMLAVENPATSSPGLAFLLATIDRFGETGSYTWKEYWRDLRANDVSVSGGWTDAYYGKFSGGADGAGDRPIVVSYASSPVAEVYYADPQPEAAPTGVVLDGCFRSVEYAAVLAGTHKGALARALVDFLLSPAVQEDVPLNMFVFPALSAATLPDVFTRFAQPVDQPLTMDPAAIEAGREAWIEDWTQIVLR